MLAIGNIGTGVRNVRYKARCRVCTQSLGLFVILMMGCLYRGCATSIGQGTKRCAFSA